jgi:hypothetical protein
MSRILFRLHLKYSDVGAVEPSFDEVFEFHSKSLQTDSGESARSAILPAFSG